MESLLNAFRGRMNRARFWRALSIILPSFIALIVVFWVYAFSIPGAYENGGPTPMPHNTIGIVAAVAWFCGWLALLIGLLAVTVRRLHDRDKAWWWILIFIFLPDIISVYGQYRAAAMGGQNIGPAATIGGLVTFALFVWAFVELGCLPGTKGDNRFGPDPLAF